MVPRLLVIASALGVALPAAAHPGHGDASVVGWLHLLTEPRHAVALMAAIALCAAIGALGQRRRVSLRTARREARLR